MNEQANEALPPDLRDRLGVVYYGFTGIHRDGGCLARGGPHSRLDERDNDASCGERPLGSSNSLKVKIKGSVSA